MIKLELHSQGVILPIHAQPGARSSGIRGEHAGALKVCVTQPAEKGKANKALAGVICRQLNVRKSQIELVSGATTRQKRYLIRDVTLEELADQIETVLGEARA